MLKASRCFALSALMFVSLGSLCLAGTEPLFYIYQGQPKALTLDSASIAVHVNPTVANSHAGAIPMSLATQGFSEADVMAQPVPGWMILSARNALTRSRTNGLLAASAEDASSVHALLTSLLASGDPTVEFVSPVFRDDAGDPIILTPTVLIGFQKDFSTARQSQLLAAVPEGAEPQKVEFPQPQTQRWELHSRDGFAALDRANTLAQTSGVTYAELDMIVTGHANLIPTDPLFAQSWGLRNIGQSGGQAGFDLEATSAWDITTGSSSVIVLILDVGVQQNHPDINQVTGKDFTSDAPSNPNGGPFGTYDNHGTWVAGCVSGLINNGLGTAGIAPGVKVASARCYNNGTSTGTFTFQFSWVADALSWGQSIGARVSNNSNYYTTTSSTIEAAYANTRANGMVHFASAGNDGTASISYPSSISSVNSVGAANRFGERSSFSQYGLGLKYLAPGEEIYTTDRTGSAGGVAGDYVQVYGTSFASPYAAGIAALIISQTPGVSVADIESQLQTSCRDMGPAGYDTGYGYGIVDAYRALAPRITSILNPPSVQIGSSFSYQITASNNPTHYSAVGLPAGLQLDPATGIISGIPTLSGTYYVALIAQGPQGDVSGQLILVVAAAAQVVTEDVPLARRSLQAYSIAVDQSRNLLYAGTSNSVVVLNLDTLAVVQAIPISDVALDLCLSNDGSKLWAATPNIHKVSVIDLNSRTLLPGISVPGRPFQVREGTGNRLYVATDNGVMQVDNATGSLGAEFTASGGDYTGVYTLIEISPDKGTLFVADTALNPGSVARFDVSTANPVSLQESNQLGDSIVNLNLSFDGKFLTVVSNSGASYYEHTPLVDATNLSSVLGALNALVVPGQVAFNSDSSLAYQLQRTNPAIDVYNRITFARVRQIRLPDQLIAQHMAVASNSRLVVAAENPEKAEVQIYFAGINQPVPAPPKSLVNVSTRTFVETGDNVEIGGFIIQGDQPKKVVLRAIGPSLTAYQLPAVTDPVLELHNSTGAIIATNDNWNSHRQDVLNTGLAPSNEHEAVIVTTLAPGNYTVILSGLNDATGTALFELYDVDPTNSRVANISTRANVGTGDNVMIGGFIIGGDQPTKIIARAIGPSLTQFGLSTALLDPTLELHDGSGNVVSQNDDWRSDQEQLITNSGLAPSDDHEAAIIATLPPGNYTAIVRGKNDTTGIGLVEVYNLEPN